MKKKFYNDKKTLYYVKLKYFSSFVKSKQESGVSNRMLKLKIGFFNTNDLKRYDLSLIK